MSTDSQNLVQQTLNQSQGVTKNAKNLSIKEFFTSKLMRARSFEGNANSPRDETSNWFDEFKARMSKKTQSGTNRHVNSSISPVDDSSNDASAACEPATNQASSQPKVETYCQAKADNSSNLVKDKSDTDSGLRFKQIGEENDPSDTAKQSLDDTSCFDLNFTELRERRLHKVSCIERPDFDTASINTIYNRRDSRYESRDEVKVPVSRSRPLIPLRSILLKCLPLDYNLPWKVITFISLALILIMTTLLQQSNPKISTLSFLNGFFCGLVIGSICCVVLALTLIMTFLPLSQESESSPVAKQTLSSKITGLDSSASSKKLSQNQVCPELKPDDFSTYEILDAQSRNASAESILVEKTTEPLDEEDYKGWMIEFVGDYELRNKSDVKLRLIYVKIENRVMYLCKPKNGHDAESSIYPTFISQRIYDLNTVKKFSANLLLPRSVRNRQKWVWSKKYPIRLDFLCENDLVSTRNEALKEVNLTLFAKSCREKEEWFRRFKTIVEDNRLAQFSSMKRCSLESDVSVYTDEMSPTSSRGTSIRSPSPSGLVQTSKSSHFLDSQNRITDDENIDDQTSSSSLKRTKSCDEINQATSMKSNELNVERPDILQFKSECRDDDTLTRETAELFSQVVGDSNFLDSRPNLCYREYIERIIDSGRDATITSDWFNALTGRIFFDVFSHNYWSVWFKRKIQRKLYRIRLPYFMETLTLTKIDLGTNAPHFLNVSSHSFDSFGLSIDFDMTYNGGLTMTFETKLNLLKIKSDNSGAANMSGGSSTNLGGNNQAQNNHSTADVSTKGDSASDSATSSSSNKDFVKPSFSSSGSARTSGESSDSDESGSDTSSDSSTDDEGNHDEISDWEDYGAEKTRQNIVKLVDKIASSRYFQHATENRYIKKKLQHISNCPLVLVVQIQSLNGILTLNVPPPQTDRVWYGFKPNPELTLKALPKMGDREVNMSHVTDWIERKLAEEFRKILVIPNMEDIVLPVLKSDHLSYVASTK